VKEEGVKDIYVVDGHDGRNNFIPYKIKFPVRLKIRRIGPKGTIPDNPYFSEKEFIVKSGLDIISGTEEIRQI
jgi:hypothetical protein